ncbi:TAM41 (YGR046W) [Zygosaccharomyces parabailii]|nr:TAM41 (YGR046W) [Zygosaccharomyces parabailii]CDH09764.1 related to Mitochondrial translocator assembly and maintenance protein 41 [Zygosaccharomyces bailii ISA1307]
MQATKAEMPRIVALLKPQNFSRWQSTCVKNETEERLRRQAIIHGKKALTSGLDAKSSQIKPPISTATTTEDDLALLERGIRKTDELASSFTDYTYKFERLPPNFGSNQLLTVNSELQTELESIVGSFRAPVKYAFGYGSGVFEQSGYSDKEKPQIDLIFGVSHPSHFHSLNMRQNPHHYSTLRYFGSGFVSKFQEIGAGIFFNPFADIQGHQVKYGVVSMDNLLKDLATWNTFYLAGRLQKPVKVLKNDLRVMYWNQLNLKAAASLAKYLTLKKNDGKFDEISFYKEIAGLSYLGDVRYQLGGENPNKVANIVTKNFDNFRRYYEPIYKDVVYNNSLYLPRDFKLETATSQLQGRIYLGSTTQMLKGIFTAGILKSVKYAWAKKLKTWNK